MLQTLNTIKNQIKELAEGQKKVRQVLTLDHSNYTENYKQVFGADAKVPPMWSVQADPVSTRGNLFELYTAYYIVKHRLQDDYAGYKEAVTSSSFLANDDWKARCFWSSVDRHVKRWTAEILDELEARERAKGGITDSTAVA